MKEGDRVRLKFRREVTGTVTQVQHDVYKGRRAFVDYDDPQWIPPKDWHELEYLELIETKEEIQLKAFKKCTCGLGYSMSGGRHSDWCDLVRKD